MRRLLALSPTIALLSLGAVGTSSAELPATPRRPFSGPSRPSPFVGRRADRGRHVGRSSRHRSRHLQTGGPAHPRRAGCGARSVGKAWTTPADPTRLVTMRELDAQLVSALGLADAAKRIRTAADVAGLAPTCEARNRDRCATAGSSAQPSAGAGSAGAAPEPAGDAGGGRVFARSCHEAVRRSGRLARHPQPDVLRARDRRVATDRADARIAVRRISIRLGRHLRVDAEAVELHCSRRHRDPAGVASIARGSSGACTRRSRFPVHPSSATCSRDGRRTQ